MITSLYQHLFLSFEEKKRIFLMQLVQAGVPYSEALKAAEIVASESSTEDLSLEDRALVKSACRDWLNYRKRQARIDQAIAKISQRQ